MSHIGKVHATFMSESCHTQTGHSTKMQVSRVTHDRVMSHVWTSHVTHTLIHVACMNESYHTNEWVRYSTRTCRSHVSRRQSHVAHMNESCHTYEQVISHTRMSDVTHMNEWGVPHICKRVMAHIWARYVAHMNESCHTHEKKRYTTHRLTSGLFFWWVLQHCTGFARLVWGRLRVHLSFHLFKSMKKRGIPHVYWHQVSRMTKSHVCVTHMNQRDPHMNESHAWMHESRRTHVCHRYESTSHTYERVSRMNGCVMPHTCR